jgi:nucleoside-diphosphate-sugar epimerase
MTNNRKRVLLTGGSGFVGKAVYKVLSNAGYNIKVGTRNEDLSKDGHIFIDFKTPNSILNVRNEEKFDAIIHLGARVALGSDINIQEISMINTIATDYLAQLAKYWNSYFLFASTAIVHGSTTEHITLNSPYKLDTHYAKSKWQAERCIIKKNIRSAIFRIAGVFGESGPSHLTINQSITNAIEENIIPNQIGNGLALRNYIYVNDLAKWILFAVDHETEGVHMVANNRTCSMRQMLTDICDVYIPGSTPHILAGIENKNQVVEPSLIYDKMHSFRSALIDIKSELNRSKF